MIKIKRKIQSQINLKIVATLILIFFIILIVAFSFYLPYILTNHSHQNVQFCNICKNIERITQYWTETPWLFINRRAGLFLVCLLLFLYFIHQNFQVGKSYTLVRLKVRMDNWLWNTVKFVLELGVYKYALSIFIFNIWGFV